MTTVTVSSGQTLSGTTVLSGGTSVGTIVLNPGDTLIVANGGTAEALTLTGETISVTSGGTASGLAISNGGVMVLPLGGKAIGTSVFSGGVVSEGGTAPSNSGLSIGAGGLLDLTLATGSQTLPVTVVSGAKVEFGGIATSGIVSSSSTASTTTLSVVISGGAHESIVFAGGSQTFTSATTGSGTAARDVFTLTCFVHDTQILSGPGEVSVEAIRPGDTVSVLRNGVMELEPVIWVGKSRINLAQHARPELVAPIRVTAGALADNIPTRDLLLSPEHCLIIADRCIPVKLLVNGGSIFQEYPVEPIEYFHLELERHGILFAEGATTESYLDTGNRSSFDNSETPRMLHKTFLVNETAARWKIDACAPLAAVPSEVVPVWEALAERSAALGHKVRMPEMIQDPDLHVLADGQHIQPVSDRDCRYVFMVPAGVKSVTLASRFCVPTSKMVSSQRDTRRLGVSVDWIAIRSAGTETIFSADHPALQGGWHDAERSDTAIWRWTDGAATIPWEGVTGSTVVTVRCTPVDQYPVHDVKTQLVA